MSLPISEYVPNTAAFMGEHNKALYSVSAPAWTSMGCLLESESLVELTKMTNVDRHTYLGQHQPC